VRSIGILTWLALVGVLSAATLSNPRRVGTGFEFSVTGASNAVYAIEASLDLQNWTRVVTNREVGEVRTISLPASDQQEFYRARLLQRLFTGAMGVRESIYLRGNGVQMDSFDSADPLASTDGQYDPAKARDHADIMTTNSGLTNSLDLANAKVRGVLYVAPGGGVIIGPSASIGSSLWVSSGQFGIEPGHLVEGTSRVFVNAELPTGRVYVTPGPGTINGTNYQYVLSDGHYTLPELRYSTVVTGRATLYVSGSALPNRIVILPDASLNLYVGGPDAAIRGVVNESRNAAAFAYYGLPGNINIAVQGNANFQGTIYAPAAYVGVGGGGSDEVDFTGSIVGRIITVNGKMLMHYDERLGLAGPEL
jgi:hypothetical protein